MFRIIDRRLRSASSKLENSAEMVLAKAQQQSAAVRSLSLRSRSKSSNRSREQKGTEEEEEEREGGGTSRTLLGLLSPRNWTTTATGEGEVRAGSGTDPKSAGEEQQPQEGREMNYVEVRNTDTLEGIAAAHDCTVGMLVKMNKLPSRMVYPGQKLLVPSSDTANAKIINNNNNDKLCKGPGHAVRATSTEVTQPSSDQHQFGPSTAFNFGPADEKAKDQNIAKDQTMPMARRSNAELGRMASELDPEDQECMQRFLKIRVKQVTESDGTIVGTLLVTPNCLMFDPDIDHPLVMENGSDLYGMIANMEDIVSVTVYKNIASLIGEKPNKEEDIFDPKNVTGTPKKSNGKKSKREESIELEEQGCRPRTASDARSIPKPNGHSRSVDDHDQVVGLDDGHPLVYGTSAGGLLLSSTLEERNAMLLSESSLSNSEQQLPSINEEWEEAKHHQKVPTKPMDDGGRGITEKRRTVSDMHCQADDLVGSKDSGASSPSIQSDQLKWLKNGQQSNSLDLQPSVDSEERRRTHSDLEQSNSLELGKNRLKSGDPNQRRSPSPSAFSRYSPGIARRSFGKLGRTLSAKATSIKGTVQSGAQSVATGTQKVAHGVVTHTLSAADHIQTGIQTGAKVMASVPSSIVNVSTELLQEGQSGMKEVVDQLRTLGAEEIDQKSPQAMKREKSLATLESLRQQTHQKREQAAVQKALDTGFVLGAEESPALDDCDNADASRPIGTPPDPPYYMIVRVDRRRKRKKQRPVFVCDSSTDNQQQLEGAVNGSNSGSLSASSAELAPQQQQEESCAFGNKRKREFWFAIPRNRVDAIYHFLLQWSPQKYGQEKASTADETNEFNNNNNNTATTERVLDQQQGAKGKQHLGGFVVLEGDVDDTLAGE